LLVTDLFSIDFLEFLSWQTASPQIKTYYSQLKIKKMHGFQPAQWYINISLITKTNIDIFAAIIFKSVISETF